MCLRIRQEQTELKASGTTLTPPDSSRLRPRLAGAAAVALVAGLAAAAMVMPPSAPQAAATQQQSGAPVRPAATTTTPASTAPTSGSQDQNVSSGLVIEQTSTTMDDGVPTDTGVARSTMGGCQHAL
jgi:hypothetical protein